jgi:hypothetical protein
MSTRPAGNVVQLSSMDNSGPQELPGKAAIPPATGLGLASKGDRRLRSTALDKVVDL